MKKFLLLALGALMFSCTTGNVDSTAGATKLLIQNDSKTSLQNVTWRSTEFGNINSSRSAEGIIASEDEAKSDNLKFYVQGVEYYTEDSYEMVKLRTNPLILLDNTVVIKKTQGTQFNLGNLEVEIIKKIIVQNNSTVSLFEVTWSGLEFGNINPGGRVEKEVQGNENGPVYFKIKAGGDLYRTVTQFSYSDGDDFITFSDNMPVRKGTDPQTTLIGAYDAAN